MRAKGENAVKNLRGFVQVFTYLSHEFAGENIGVGVGTYTQGARLPRFQRACPSTALDKLEKAIQLYLAKPTIYAHRAQIRPGDRFCEVPGTG